MAEHLIDTIRAEKDISPEKLEYMNEVDAMIKEMRITYEKALKKKIAWMWVKLISIDTLII